MTPTLSPAARAARAQATPEERSAEAARKRASKARKAAAKGETNSNTPVSLVSQQPQTKTAPDAAYDNAEGLTTEAEKEPR